MNYKRIDALEIKYADSSALKKLKIKTVKESKGGEKRLYIANCKEESEELDALNMNRKRLGLNENAKYQLQKGCEIYLKYHRENIFNKMPDLDDL